MYLFGAWLKKCEIPQKIKSIYAVFTVIISTLVTWGLYITGNIKFFSYISPTIVLNAVSLVILFSKINLKGFAVKVVKFLSPAAFGVYLIHDNNLVRENFMSNNFVWITHFEWYFIPPVALGCAIGIFITCLFIEKIRLLIFKYLKIDTFINIIAPKVENILKKYADVLIGKIS